MEDVLEVYKRPYDTACPVVCMGEQPTQLIKELPDADYPDAHKVLLACGKLNTHKSASLYQAFAPQEARRLLKRLEIHYSPKHGSWPNIAECELSVLSKQCLDRRIPDIENLREQARHCYCKRNGANKSVDWQLARDKARMKLKRLGPQFQMS